MKHLTRNSNLATFFYGLTIGEEFVYSSAFGFDEVAAEAAQRGVKVEVIVGKFACLVTETIASRPKEYHKGICAMVNMATSVNILQVTNIVRAGIAKLPESKPDSVLIYANEAKHDYEEAIAAVEAATVELKRTLCNAVDALPEDWSQADIGKAFGYEK